MTTARSRTRALLRRPRAGALPILGLLLVAGVVVAACGGPDGGPTGAQDNSAAAGDPILDFYQCLRDNGLDVPDPEPGGGDGTGGLEGVDPDDPDTMAILQECSGREDGRVTVGDGEMGENLADTEALIEFVDCMRENSIDMPDPEADGRLPLPDGYDPESAEFQAAVQQCSRHLSGGGILIGEPGGGGTAGRR